MASFNRIIMVGNLTRDPDYKQFENGQAICKLGVASNRQFKNRITGGVTQEVCFVDVDVWGAQAESCRQYLQKGRPVLIEGRLKFDQWQDNEGNNRSKHTIVADRVVFLGSNQAETASDISGDSSFDVQQDESNSAPKKRAVKKTGVEGLSSKPVFKDEPPFEDDLPF